MTPNGLLAARRDGEHQAITTAKFFREERRIAHPALGPVFEVGELCAQSGRLNRVEARVRADQAVPGAVGTPVSAHELKALGDVGIVGGDTAGVAYGSQIF